jgi:hypothetical protein
VVRWREVYADIDMDREYHRPRQLTRHKRNTRQYYNKVKYRTATEYIRHNSNSQYTENIMETIIG